MVGRIICGLYDSFIIVESVVRGVCNIVVNMFVMFNRVKLLVNLGMLIKYDSGNKSMVLVSMLIIIIGLMIFFGILRLIVNIVKIILNIKVEINSSVLGELLNKCLILIKLVLRVLGINILMVLVISVVSIKCYIMEIGLNYVIICISWLLNKMVSMFNRMFSSIK